MSVAGATKWNRRKCGFPKSSHIRFMVSLKHSLVSCVQLISYFNVLIRVPVAQLIKRDDSGYEVGHHFSHMLMMNYRAGLF